MVNYKGDNGNTERHHFILFQKEKMSKNLSVREFERSLVASEPFFS